MFSLNGNWVDLVILVILLYYVLEGYRVGFWGILADFLSFLGSLLLSLRAYKFTAGLLRSNFSLSHSLSNAIGFLLTVVVLEIALSYLFAYLISQLPEKIKRIKWNRELGIIPALGEGIILTAFILSLILGLPLKPSFKKDITESKIGSYILKATQGAEKNINEIFGGAIEDSLTSLMIRPGSKESVPLEVGRQELAVDERSEAEMFRLINEERKKQGVRELIWYPEVIPVARAHAKDMWEREYFSHYSPEGEDVGDRLEKAQIKYFVAGENLALAPTLSTAHSGLMNSEGHRVNILSTDFNRVGVGVIDNGVYGKMFVQIFTD